MTSREPLIVRGTGRVRGTVTYGDTEIERGGQVKGESSSAKSARLDQLETL